MENDARLIIRLPEADKAVFEQIVKKQNEMDAGNRTTSSALRFYIASCVKKGRVLYPDFG